MRAALSLLPLIGLCCSLSARPAGAQSIQSRSSEPGKTAVGTSAPEKSAITQLQLLEGVRLFRAEQYDEALRVFQQIDAEQQPADIGFYLGMALHKLGRHLPALVAFRSAARSGLHEPVADYYSAVSCYRLGMLSRARLGFTALVEPASAGAAPGLPLGPRLQEGARRFLAALPPRGNEASSPGGTTAGQRCELAQRNSERLLLAEDLDGALEWLEEGVRAMQEIADKPEQGSRQSELQRLWSRLRAPLSARSPRADLATLDRLLGN